MYSGLSLLELIFNALVTNLQTQFILKVFNSAYESYYYIYRFNKFK